MNRAQRAAKDRRERLDTIEAGLQAEVDAINGVLRDGHIIRIPPRPGNLMAGKEVACVRLGWDGLWVTMRGYGGSYALANDSRWAEVCELAGVGRDPRALGIEGTMNQIILGHLATGS